MNRDPFYRQIVEGLGGRLDPDLFERCAADLVRDDFPGTVPIPGGTDYGMDGAVADGEGTAYPVVTTTAKDVIGNLTRNLKRYADNGGSRRKAVLVTSRELTAKRRRNLEQRAQDLGFTLVQIYDRAAVADRLYSRPQWCRELLGLVGDPPPLSVIPRSYRPLGDQLLIGRQEDLDWIRATDGDLLLVGQSGSGKTFLFHALAKEDWGLFVVSDDLGQVADGIRQQRPAVLIVDDAHIQIEQLEALIRLRREMQADFRIAVSSWPGEAERVAEVLTLPDSGIRSLQPLTRDEIVQVVNGAGLLGPDDLIRAIVDQAQGQPGLAVTLTQLCLREGVRDVALGEALARLVRTTVESLVGAPATEILAAFAIGGSAGMQMEHVAAALGLSLIDARRAVTRLAAGGIITEAGRQALVVQPAPLRHALVRTVFFAGAASLPVDRLMASAPDHTSVTRTLIGARHGGARVPDALLSERLEQDQSMRSEVWYEYAWLGRREVEAVLNRHPERLIDIAEPALDHAPDIAIPALLTAAVGDDTPPHTKPHHPLRLVEDWVAEAWPGTDVAVPRRRELLHATRGWLHAGGASRVGLHALGLALSPAFRQVSTDPGEGMSVQIREGLLSQSELEQLQALWPETFTVLRWLPEPHWPTILHLVGAWAYPGRSQRHSVSDSIWETMRGVAKQMLHDIAELAHGRPGVLQAIREIGRDIGVHLHLDLPSEFETLFPDEQELRDGDWDKVHERWGANVRKLALELADEDASVVARRLAHWDREAILAERHGPRLMVLLARELAQHVAAPTDWARALVEAQVAGDLLPPFLRAAAPPTSTPSTWHELLALCLDRPNLRGSALEILLTVEEPPKELFERALAAAGHYDQLVEILCQAHQVPPATLEALLSHPDVRVAGAAAVGEWWGAQPSGLRPRHEAIWRTAVLRTASVSTRHDYLLGEILERGPQLAHDWLRRHLRGTEAQSLWRLDSARHGALEGLDAEGRWCILSTIPDVYGDEGFAATLVGNDVELYRRWLASDIRSDLHLAPIGGRPVGPWIAKAQAALDAGFSAEQVVAATFGHTNGWMGDESAHWASWAEQFATLQTHEDERLRDIGRRGQAIAEAQRRAALIDERHEAVYGRRRR